MGSTVVGVIVGALIPVSIQILTFWKEQKQWEKQQAVEKEVWLRNERKKENEYLREIYQNSLRSLSVFIALVDQKDEEQDKQKRMELIDEIHKWVTILLLRHSNTTLGNVLTSFNHWPDESAANRLREEIIKSSKRERGFFINKLSEQPEDIKESIDPGVREIQITINDDFRKQQLIEGVEIPQSHTFKFKLSEMSNSQREKLSDIYFQKYKTIPPRFELQLPVHNDGVKQIQMNGKQWKAKLNPNSTEQDVILDSWEKDFDESYKEAKLSLDSLMEK